MKNLLKYSLSITMLFFFTASIWASSLDIHHIGVGQGDATLFVFTDNNGLQVNILIDTGNSNGKGTEVFNYLKRNIKADKDGDYVIDILITSHLHSDHYGGTPELLRLLKQDNYNWFILNIIDRGAEIAPNPDEYCYDNGGDWESNDPINAEQGEPIATPITNLYNRYVKAIKDYFPHAIRQSVPVGTELFSQVIKTTYTSTKFWCLTKDAQVLNKYNTNTVMSNTGTPKSENDLSFSWLIQYEGFKYFSGGDLGGSSTGNYLDLETPLCNTFKTWPSQEFHFCSFKASHHGSAHSTNTDFVSTKCSNPTLAIVPSALRSFSGTQIPTLETLKRITGAVGNNIFYTFIKDDGKYYEGKVVKYNHVKLSVENPGIGKPIAMNITQRWIDKTNLNVEGTSWGSGIITCSKEHD